MKLSLVTFPKYQLALYAVAILLIKVCNTAPLGATNEISVRSVGSITISDANSAVVQSANDANEPLQKNTIKHRRRNRNKKKRSAKARLLRSEGNTIDFNIQQNPSAQQGSKTLGLQWVLDIRRNLTSLMKGLEQVEQQLAEVKEQMQQKNTMTELQPVIKIPNNYLNSVSASPIVCPWEMLNGGHFNKCYSFHINDRRSWYQAAAACRVVGGRLLRIGSAQETSFLLARAPAWMSSGTAWLTTTWTDGNRLYPCPKDGGNMWPSETSWGWGTRMDRLCFDQLADEKKNPITVYTDWLMSADPQAGACVALAVASTNWEALDCDRPAAYVCEKDPVSTDMTLMNDASGPESINSDKINAEQDDDNPIQDNQDLNEIEQPNDSEAVNEPSETTFDENNDDQPAAEQAEYDNEEKESESSSPVKVTSEGA